MFRERQAASSVLDQYFNAAQNARRLTREEEAELARRVRLGHADAVQQLVVSNLGFVAKVASGYRNLGVPYEDLLIEGNLGLIEAARRFDPRRQTRFLTYAVWWIRRSIFSILDEQSSLVRVPVSEQRRLRRLREEAAPGAAVVPPAVVVVPLDADPGHDSMRSMVDLLVDERHDGVEQELIRRQYDETLPQALGVLPERERRVIALRFGLDGLPALTLQQIGDLFRVSRERVRQIEATATARLRAFYRKQTAIRPPAQSPPRDH